MLPKIKLIKSLAKQKFGLFLLNKALPKPSIENLKYLTTQLFYLTPTISSKSVIIPPLHWAIFT